MPKTSDSGKTIITAGEVGAFVVCPESWRLKYIENLETSRSPAIKAGAEGHKSWVKRYDQTVALARYFRLTIALFLLALILFLLLKL